MYGVYNVETLENLINTLHSMHNSTAEIERLFAAGLESMRNFSFSIGKS